MSCERTIYGKVLLGSEFDVVEGYICVKEGIITEIGEESSKTDNIIAPCFVNSHTHIGDSVYKDPQLGIYDGFRLKHDIDSLVRPPNGLKHKILQDTPYSVLVDSMKVTVLDMLATGTCAFADFREGGVVGVMALKEALDDFNMDALILGRPNKTEPPIKDVLEEVDRVLREADGLGMSGTNDMDMEIFQSINEHVKKQKRLFAIHAGEKNNSDIASALSLYPDILIHLTNAECSDLAIVADAKIPVVVCPRSNYTTGAGMAPIADMLDNNIIVGVGTDNVMLNSVNMFAEMEFLSKIFGLADRQVFKMCTLNGASLLGLDDIGSIKKGNRANLMILNGKSSNLSGVREPLNGIVRRARPDDILSIIHV
ncbi:MAG: amidohydrolase family protein [Methanosarcinaceae archaeon]|nr:amidohydrolase family protein [Methanosarcinaceae archaeon]